MTDNPFDLGYVEPAEAAPEQQPDIATMPVSSDHITFHKDFDQGSMEWLKARCGLLTASEMKHILTPTLKLAANDKTRMHLYELLSQRITGYVEETFESYDILRGREDEIEARLKYSQEYEPVTECGFVTNDEWGFKIGYSPDGLVGDDGLIEAKSRKQKYQVQTIVEYAAKNTIPTEFMAQVQTGLLVTGRKWCDFISYSGGMAMTTIRVEPIAEYQDAIIAAATDFEAKLADARAVFDAMMASGARMIATERSTYATGDLK
jgi:hypothetical protein